MPARKSALFFAAFTTATVPMLHGQYAAPPDAYSVTEVNALMGPAATMKIYRDGPRAVLDNSYPAGTAPHIRAFYDLQSKKTISWTPEDTKMPCTSGTFGGDWGDPFAMSKELNGQLAQQHAAQVGAESVNGFSTKVYEAAMGGGAGKARAWVDTRYGLIVKLQMGGNTMLEVKEASFSRPSASTFALPASCSAASLSAPAGTSSTAGASGFSADFTSAILPPASRNPCTVLLRVVRADTMEPIAGGFQLALDKTIDPEHMPHYSESISAGGRIRFSGGGMAEVTGQMQNGTLRIDNAPAQFYAEAAFGNGGESSALIYRQCFAPQTVLLLVVKNPQQMSQGVDWEWVKSGKYAR